MTFLRGTREIALDVQQRGSQVVGAHDLNGVPGALRGTVSRDRVRLVLASEMAGGLVTYRIAGRVSGDRCVGKAALGMSDPEDDGPDRSADQYGEATFAATRSS
jgi:hypothetical protein